MAGEIELIKQKLHIEDVVGKYVKSLNQSGRNLKGLCPFHQEKTPSFMVNPELGIFKCFGCGEGGDVISFLQKIERLDFGEALEMSAEMAGVTLDRSSLKQNKEQQQQYKRIKELNAAASQYFHYLLVDHPSGKSALAYAVKRGMSIEMIKEFQLGYAPPGDNLVKFMQKRGFKSQELTGYGLAIEKSGKLIDKFRQRLVFPIFDLKGDVVGFSARTLIKDGIPKFLNSPETPVYHKSELLYGFFQAKEAIRKSGFVILFEGNVDIVNSHRLGIANVACPLGTALTITQLQLIKRYCEKVYFCFDTDQAGFKALIRGIALAEQIGIEHRAIDLGTYHDADDLMMANPPLWAERVGAAENSISHVLKILEQKCDLATPEGKLEFRRQALPVLKLVRDAVEFNHFAAQIGKLLGVTDDVIKASVNATKPPAQSTTPASEIQLDSPINIEVPTIEKTFLAVMLNYPRGKVSDVSDQFFSSEAAREVFINLSKGTDLTTLKEQLTPMAQALLMEIAMLNLPADIPLSYNRLKTRLKQEYLKSQVNSLHERLDAMPDDELTINKLDALTKELNELQRPNAKAK